MTTSSTGTDRWDALDFGPPPSEGDEPDESVLVEYLSDGRVAVDHAEPAARRQRHHDRDGRAADGDPGDDRGPPSVRVAIITGAGQRAFSVGSDLRQRKDMTKEQWLRQRQDFDRTLYTLRQLRKPIFAAVNGIAYGGGSEIAQSTDFIIASDNATFGQPEAMIGLAAGGGSPVMLPRLLPPGKALQMLMTGDPITADEAHRLGMVNELHPQAELHGRGDADRREDRQQLPHRGPSGQAGRAPGRGPADRAGDRDHDGGPLALRSPPGPHRGHRRLQRGPRPDLPGFRLLTTRNTAHVPPRRGG